MKRIMMAVIGLVLSVWAPVLLAQDDEEPQRFTYATYFYCNNGMEAAADEFVKRNAEVYDQMVEDGEMLAWGWMSHHTGGKWRRIQWHQNDSLAGVVAATDAMGAAVAEKFGEDDAAGDAFAAACPQHDDYVWQVTDGMSGVDRGTVGFSVYHKCDIGREERADEIVAKHVAPALNKMVEEGKLTSWGWQSHVVGGGIRKLQTMSAKDLPTLLAARTASIAAIYGEEDKVGEEFVDICGPHADYIWNMVHEKIGDN